MVVAKAGDEIVGLSRATAALSRKQCVEAQDGRCHIHRMSDYLSHVSAHFSAPLARTSEKVCTEISCTGAQW